MLGRGTLSPFCHSLLEERLNDSQITTKHWSSIGSICKDALDNRRHVVLAVDQPEFKSEKVLLKKIRADPRFHQGGVCRSGPLGVCMIQDKCHLTAIRATHEGLSSLASACAKNAQRDGTMFWALMPSQELMSAENNRCDIIIVQLSLSVWQLVVQLWPRLDLVQPHADPNRPFPPTPLGIFLLERTCKLTGCHKELDIELSGHLARSIVFKSRAWRCSRVLCRDDRVPLAGRLRVTVVERCDPFAVLNPDADLEKAEMDGTAEADSDPEVCGDHAERKCEYYLVGDKVCEDEHESGSEVS